MRRKFLFFIAFILSISAEILYSQNSGLAINHPIDNAQAIKAGRSGHPYDICFTTDLEAPGKELFKNNIGPLNYKVRSSDSSRAIPSMNGTVLTVKPLIYNGATYITITGIDTANNDSLSYTFTINMIHAGIEDNNNTVPKDCFIFQNYPNPFNPATAIKYILPKGDYVTIKIFNLLGEYITTLINEYKPAGNYIVSFNGDGLASGIYIAVINTRNFTQSIKMNLTK